MAINTRNHRSSAINVGLPWRAMLSAPDGSIDQLDRAQLLFLYSGTFVFTPGPPPTYLELSLDPRKHRIYSVELTLQPLLDEHYADVLPEQSFNFALPFLAQTTLVQIIPASALALDAGTVRVTLEFIGTILEAWIGHPGGGDVIDFDGNQVQITVNGATSYSGSGSIKSDNLTFALDHTKPVLIAACMAANTAPYGALFSSGYSYYTAPGNDAATTDKTLGSYTAGIFANTVFLAIRIEKRITQPSPTTHYAATDYFITRPTDDLTSQPFEGRLSKTLVVERTIVSGDRFGRLVTTWGEVEFDNSDGYYDAFPDNYGADGQLIVHKLKEKGKAYDNALTVTRNLSEGFVLDQDPSVLRLTLRDRSYLLNVPAQPNTYGGSGDMEGGTDLLGKRKIRSFGYVTNVSAVSLIAAELVYQVNDGPIHAIDNVYDKGAALTPTSPADYATNALLRAATIGAGEYATCLAEGIFRLGSAPDGLVTATGFGDNTLATTGSGTILPAAVPYIVENILLSATTLVLADLDIDAFDDVYEVQPASIGYVLMPDSTKTVFDVVGEIMDSIGGWGGFRLDDIFALGVLTDPSEDDVDASYDEIDILEIERVPLPSGYYPPPYRIRMNYDQNFTRQDTDLAGGVSAERRAYLAQEFRLAEAIDTDIVGDHKLASDPPDPLPGLFHLQSFAQLEAQRQLDLHGSTKRAFYRCIIKGAPFRHDIGHVLGITYRGHGVIKLNLYNEKMFVASMRIDADADTCEFMLWCKRSGRDIFAPSDVFAPDDIFNP